MARTLPGRPGEQSVDRPGGDDALRRNPELDGTLGAGRDEVELAGGVRVAVDREQAAGRERHGDEVVGRVATLRARVDLDRHVVLGAGGEHGLGVELALRPGATAA